MKIIFIFLKSPRIKFWRRPWKFDVRPLLITSLCGWRARCVTKFNVACVRKEVRKIVCKTKWQQSRQAVCNVWHWPQVNSLITMLFTTLGCSRCFQNRLAKLLLQFLFTKFIHILSNFIQKNYRVFFCEIIIYITYF